MKEQDKYHDPPPEPGIVEPSTVRVWRAQTLAAHRDLRLPVNLGASGQMSPEGQAGAIEKNGSRMSLDNFANITPEGLETLP